MEKLFGTVEKYREEMEKALDFLWKNPETGFREWKTQEYLKNAYEKLGYTLNFAMDIPGFYTDIDTGNPGPKILVLGEMDFSFRGDGFTAVPTAPGC